MPGLKNPGIFYQISSHSKKHKTIIIRYLETKASTAYS